MHARRSRAVVPRLVVPLVLAGLAAIAVEAKRKTPASTAPRTSTESYEVAMNDLRTGDERKALSRLQAIQYLGPERAELEPKVRLAIADATYYQGYSIARIDARSLYADFATLYSDHPQAPYALFQSAMCSMAEMKHPSKDQVDTHQTIADLNEIVRRYPASPWAGAAVRMRRIAERRLAEHEFVVGRFYAERKRPLAAIARFRIVLDQYPSYPERDKVYLYLGRALLANKNDVEARIYLDKLVKDYPDGPYADDARRELARAGGQLDLGVTRAP
jgi:outer membrane protein assembly factor BamD